MFLARYLYFQLSTFFEYILHLCYDQIKQETFQTRAPTSLQRQAKPAQLSFQNIKVRMKLPACNVMQLPKK